MKRFLPVLACSFVVGACSSSDSTDGKVAEARSALVRDTAPNVAAADQTTLANDNRAFALAAYGALAKSSSGNLFFSPYSISSAFAMTYAGAKGQTATEIATALHFTLPPERLPPAFDRVDLALTTPGPFTLHLANSLWSAPGLQFQPPFLDTLATNYGAGVFLTDFQKATAVQDVNRWVSAQTEGRIPTLFDSLPPDTRLVIVDAIDFDADWAQPFKPSDTIPAASFTTDSGSVTAPTMFNDEATQVRYTKTDAYEALEIPYQGGAVMDIVMPTAGTFAAFEPTLTAEKLHGIVASLAVPQPPVSLGLPKLTYQAEPIDLIPMLNDLGMHLAFGDADFSGISNEGLFIGKVRHRAQLRVDEKGTEAAAATGIAIEPVSARLSTPVVVDHPFFFTIRDTATDTILFAGRILDPTK